MLVDLDLTVVPLFASLMRRIMGSRLIPFRPNSIRDINASKRAAANSYQSPSHANMLISLTVGKVDAGVAVLLTEDKRLVSSQSDTESKCALISD